MERLEKKYMERNKEEELGTGIVVDEMSEHAKEVPKSLAFNLLNILIDLKTQAESNFISGQNGKKHWTKTY